jgi:hypothetical protein
MTAMQEFVVPKSMPSTFAIELIDVFYVLNLLSHPTVSVEAHETIGFGARQPSSIV